MPIRKSYVIGIGGLILLLLLPLFAGTYWQVVLIIGFFHILLASALRISLNAGQLNFGVPAFMAIGAYASALLVMKLDVPWVVAFLSAGVICAIVSLCIGYPSLRLKGVYFLILTWGFVEVIRMLSLRWISLTGGPTGLFGIPPVSLAGIEFSTKASQYYFVLFMMVVILFVLYRLEHSRFGLTLKSISQAEDLGETVGIHTYRYKVMAFAVSSFFVGLIGSLWGHSLSLVVPSTFTFWLSAILMVYCFVGGLRGFAGPVIGAAFLFILTEPLRDLVYFEQIFYGIVMVLVVLFLPGGLLSLPAKLLSGVERLKRLGKTTGTIPQDKPQ
ncbi:branched-chain amino acid ABC transporter permease [Chloroflexota bacterium]